ncbi:hypothetical protein EX30DRAFT_343302 [Ascodesmis nigricans]|uniref:lytic cellulose monooxygenase (C4-dehydrogenating) n=1 Tax=Ascodesmis nigricans TaxID=341454 RepID=A0A4S2MMR3_9PEZI|nr:hypothetical protein EX30DRAFT_343302 [Ascodesmis nigricans]
MQTTALLSLALAATASAHGIVSKIVLGSETVESYNPFQDPYMNPAPQRITWAFPSAGNGPVEDVTSRDIVCNIGATPAAISATVAAGSPIQFQWTEWPESHKGPSMTYLANCNGDCSKADPTTLSFFKIQHAGLSSSGRWASDDIIAAGSTVDARIPADIAPGNYILRHELLALHSAHTENGAQFYPMCANLVITGSGSAKPAGVKFPGAYKPTDPGIFVNIYAGEDVKNGKYVIPGPEVYTAGGTTTPTIPEPEPEESTPTIPDEESTTAPTATPTTTIIAPTQPTVAPPQTTTTPPPQPTIAPPLSTTSPSAPIPTPGSGSGRPEIDRNACLDQVNVCIRNAQSKNGGDVSDAIRACERGRERCEKLVRRLVARRV